MNELRLAAVRELAEAVRFAALATEQVLAGDPVEAAHFIIAATTALELAQKHASDGFAMERGETLMRDPAQAPALAVGLRS